MKMIFILKLLNLKARQERTYLLTRVKGFVILEGMTRTQINETKPLWEVESPLKKVTDEKELNLDFLLNKNSIARENLIPKKKIGSS